MRMRYEDSNNSLAPYSHHNPKRIELEDVNKYTLEDYGLTPEAVKAYMYGLNVIDPSTGQSMGDTFYKHAIETAIAEVESTLDIAILPRPVLTHHDYNDTEYNSFMFIKTYKRPILQVEKLSLEYNGRSVYTYPSGWWKVYSLAGHIQVSPTPLMQAGHGAGAMMLPSVGASLALMGAMGAMNSTFAPQMIHVDYVAGMLPRARAGVHQEWEMPANLEKLILKHAVKEIFQQWGRLILSPGIATRTISMDGISETIGTTASAMYGAASADLAQIEKDIDILTKGLKSYYGTNFISV